MALPIVSQPTINAAMGVFESNNSDDIFQVKKQDGSIQMHMNFDGSIDPPIFTQSAVVVLTPAQLKALHTTSVQLIPAPGPNLYISPISVSLAFKYISPEYTETGSDGDLYFGFGNTVSLITTNNMVEFGYAGIVIATSSQVQVVPVNSSAIALSTVLNQPFGIAMLDTLATGNGTLAVTVAYNVTTAP